MDHNSKNFTIDIDHDEGIVLIALSGFWNDEVMAAFEAEMAQIVAPLASSGKRWSNIGDARDLPPQSADIVARHTAVFDRCSGVWGDRVAVVIPRALTRLQARRVVDSSEPFICDSLEAARSWIIEERRRDRAAE